MTEIPFCTLDFACPYLDGRAARSEYLYIKDCDFEYNSSLVQHGYRRFGRYFQKPICAGCAECKSLRIDAANFKFSRSHRRVYKNNRTTAYAWQPRLLKQIEFAQDLGLRWIYLGYAVEQCPSLAYKFSYEPYEILNSYTELDAPAVWEGA